LLAIASDGCLFVGGLMAILFLAVRATGVGVGVAAGSFLAVGLLVGCFVSGALAISGVVLLLLGGVTGREAISVRAVSSSPS
jgi:hypothetical protein